MCRSVSSLRDQRGMALVMTLLVLLVLSGLASVLLFTVLGDTKVAGHSRGASEALNRAESGVGEATARLHSGDVPDNRNPRMVSQIFLCKKGGVPSMGPDTIALATAQPSGAWLDYSTRTRAPGALTVRYKTDASRSIIYRYDPSRHPAVQTQSGTPIYVVTSTGRKGSDTRTVVSEVIPYPFRLNLKGALTSGVDINLSGSSMVCGYEHVSDTPIGAGRDGRSGLGGCNEDPSIQHWEAGSGDMAGVWASGQINVSGGSYQDGAPGRAQQQKGFYEGPWGALGMGRDEFMRWVGTPRANAPKFPRGIFYIDNDGYSQDQSGAWSYQGGDGEGLLYVDGDLTLSGNFSFKGLIYIEGDLQINGNVWVLGAVIAKGRNEIKIANGNFTVLYSYDTILRVLNKYDGRFYNISWRELN